MSGLLSVRKWMRDALLYPRLVPADEANRMFVTSSHLSGADGLAIYQRGYFPRIANCMREQFPALCHALGQTLFDDFVAEYIREKPPQSYTLHDLGRRFPAWLEQTRPDRDVPPHERETWIDFIVDLATFERQVFVLFDAPGHDGKPFADPATPDHRLRLQPCFDLGSFRFPVPTYYHAVRLNQAPSPPDPLASFAALVRTDYVTRTVPLREPRYLFLKVMHDGGDIEDGIAAVARHMTIAHDEARQSWHAPDGARRLWLEAGFFIAV